MIHSSQSYASEWQIDCAVDRRSLHLIHLRWHLLLRAHAQRAAASRARFENIDPKYYS